MNASALPFAFGSQGAWTALMDALALHFLFGLANESSNRSWRKEESIYDFSSFFEESPQAGSALLQKVTDFLLVDHTLTRPSGF